MLKAGDYVRVKSWRDGKPGFTPYFGKIISSKWEFADSGRYAIYIVELLNGYTLMHSDRVGKKVPLLSDDIVKVKYGYMISLLV
jgi:hypothetical protein